MQPYQPGPRRKNLRATAKGIPTGRHSLRQPGPWQLTCTCALPGQPCQRHVYATVTARKGATS